MIKVTYKADSHTLTLRGHAEEYGEGSKIICAAVSAIFYNLCAMLREYPSEAFSIPFYMIEAKSVNGITTVKCEPTIGYDTWIDHDFFYALTGFETIQGNYPNAIKVVVKQK